LSICGLEKDQDVANVEREIFTQSGKRFYQTYQLFLKRMHGMILPELSKLVVKPHHVKLTSIVYEDRITTAVSKSVGNNVHDLKLANESSLSSINSILSEIVYNNNNKIRSNTLPTVQFSYTVDSSKFKI
jgi:hypothetical protein